MAAKDRPVLMPSEVSTRVGFFDRFAGMASLIASRAVFFAFCVLLIVLWFPSVFLIGNVDTWQLIINTATTIITFLMVALLQNSQTRTDQATQHKLNAIADALADLMEHQGAGTDLDEDIAELKEAVGLEDKESTSNNAAEGPARTRATRGARTTSSTGGRATRGRTKSSANGSRRGTGR